MTRKSHLFEQWITDLPISGRPARLIVGWGGEAEVEDNLKRSLDGGE